MALEASTFPVRGTENKLAQGKEKCKSLAMLGTAVDRMIYVVGKSFFHTYTQACKIKEECKGHKLQAILTVPLRSIAVAASAVFGGVVFLSALVIRSPLTIAEKSHKIALFRLTEKVQDTSQKEKIKNPSSDFSILSLNIMGLPSVICAVNGMKPCEERIDEIVKAIQDQNPDVVCLQECFLDIYAQQIMKKLPSEYRYMVSQVEGGSFTTPLGSGLVMLSKYPIEEVKVTEYTDLSGHDRFSRRGVVSTVINCEGQKIAVGNTHLQSCGLLRSRAARDEMAIAQKSVTDLAEKSGSVAKVLIGDMNTDVVEGLYRDLGEEKEEKATHYLIGKGEQKDIVKKEAVVPDDEWKRLKSLQEERKSGFRLIDQPGWKLSTGYWRSKKLFPEKPKKGDWELFHTHVSTSLSATEKGKKNASRVQIIKEGEEPSEIATMKKKEKDKKIPIYSTDQVDLVHLQNRRGIDFGFFSSKVPGICLKENQLIVIGEKRGKEWAKNVADHRAVQINIANFKTCEKIT